MKTIEVSLSDAHHRLLMEHAGRDRTHRSLNSITAGLLVDALAKETARYTVGPRQQAVSTLVAADLKRRKKVVSSAAVQEQEQEQAPLEEAALEPTFQELRSLIQEALNDYKRGQACRRQHPGRLEQSPQQEAQLLQKSLTDDSQKVVDGIARVRVEIEVQSRRVTVGEQSLAGLETITAPMIRLLAHHLTKSAPEWRSAGHHLPKCHAQRVEIRSGVQGKPG